MKKVEGSKKAAATTARFSEIGDSLSLSLFSLSPRSLFSFIFSLHLLDSYLLGKLAGQELVELGVEDAVGDELRS